MADADANKPSEWIFLSLTTVTEIEGQAVIRTFHPSQVAPLGPEVDAFKAEIAKRCGIDHASVLSSGTAGLHLALLVLDIGEGDYIPVSTMTFTATTNAIAYTGATPMFVDAAEDGNIDPELLLRTVDELPAKGKNVPGMMVMDLFSRYADYPAFAPHLEKLDIALIEDAAETFGANTGGQPAGSFDRATVLSLSSNKIMTVSDGGILLSNDTDLIARAYCLSTQARQPVAWYEYAEIDCNCRPSGLLAALGCAQHSRLNNMIAHRHQIRDVYIGLLASLDDDAPGKGIRLLSDPNGRFTGNCRLTSIALPQKAVGKGMPNPGGVIVVLGEADVETRHLWRSMHLQPAYESARTSINGTAENLLSRSTTLPSDPTLDDDDATRVIDALKEVLG